MPTRLCALLVLALFGPAAARAQDPPPALRITSPARGTVVHPGDRLVVTVEAAPGTNHDITGVALIGKDTGISETQTALPARITVTISKDASVGLSSVAAMAGTRSGMRLMSNPLSFDVEPADEITSLTVQSPTMYFRAPGETLPILLSGRRAGSAAIGLTESTRVRYVSSDRAIATVDPHGVVTATAPGQANITVRYSHAGRAVSTTIAVEVRVPPLAPARYAVEFGTQRVGASARQSLAIRNIRSGPVRLLGIETFGDFSQTNDCPAEVQGGATCTITLTFTPSQAGERTSTLSIANLADGSTVVIPLKGAGIR